MMWSSFLPHTRLRERMSTCALGAVTDAVALAELHLLQRACEQGGQWLSVL